MVAPDFKSISGFDDTGFDDRNYGRFYWMKPGLTCLAFF